MTYGGEVGAVHRVYVGGPAVGSASVSLAPSCWGGLWPRLCIYGYLLYWLAAHVFICTLLACCQWWILWSTRCPLVKLGVWAMMNFVVVSVCCIRFVVAQAVKSLFGVARVLIVVTSALDYNLGPWVGENLLRN